MGRRKRKAPEPKFETGTLVRIEGRIADLWRVISTKGALAKLELVSEPRWATQQIILNDVWTRSLFIEKDSTHDEEADENQRGLQRAAEAEGAGAENR